jgi:solute carrier family 25 protein 38
MSVRSIATNATKLESTATVPPATTKPAKHLYAGFLSGLTSAILLQPLDLIKTRVQQSKGSTITSSLKEVTSIGSLWRGTIPSALRTSVGSALYFTTLNAVRGSLAHSRVSRGDSSLLPKLSMHENLLSGAAVRGVVGFVTMPITVIKVRYESSFYKYTSMLHAVKSVYSSHGLGGFFYGYGVTFARDAPYAGLYVLFYEKSKEALNGLFPSVEKRSVSTAAIINSSSAAFSAGLATTITGPFDTIKTRVQLDPAKYRSFWRAAKLIARHEGFLSLFDGLSLRLTRKAMSAGISWCMYEELVRRFHPI